MLLTSELIPFLAFSAHSTVERRYINSPQPATHRLVFDSVLLNDGGAYNPQTSSFTCPVTAYYAFFAGVSIKHVEYYPSIPYTVALSLYKGGAPLYRHHVSEELDSYEFSYTFQVTTTCSAGEEVFINMLIDMPNFENAGIVDVNGPDGAYPRTSFSGFIIRDV